MMSITPDMLDRTALAKAGAAFMQKWGMEQSIEAAIAAYLNALIEKGEAKMGAGRELTPSGVRWQVHEGYDPPIPDDEFLCLIIRLGDAT